MIRLRLAYRAGSLLLVALLSGCFAAVPREAGFPDVERTVAERTGYRVHWNRGSASDRAVEATVRSMLAKQVSADEAVQVALLNNRNLQATYEELAVAQADLVSAGLLRNPVFDAEVRFIEGGGGTGLELAVVQDFIDVLFIPLRTRLAGAAFEAAKARVAGDVLDLAGQVRGAFYTLQAAQQTREMRVQILAATEASYDLARRLRAAGNIRELDLATEQVLFEQSKLDVRAAETQVVQSRERLNRLMGLWGPQTQWRAVPRLPDLPSDQIPAETVERRAVERSLDLASARLAVSATGTRLGIAAPLGLLPEGEAGASAEREPDGEWAVGPAVSLPIPLFSQGQPAIAAARSDLRRAQQEYHATAVAVRSHARAAHDAVAAALDQVQQYRRVILPLRQKVVTETQLQYNAMQVSPLQLLLAKQQQIQAGEDYIQALRAFWLARTDLDVLLAGRMTSFSGGEGASALEPASTPASGGRGDH